MVSLHYDRTLLSLFDGVLVLYFCLEGEIRSIRAYHLKHKNDCPLLCNYADGIIMDRLGMQ